MMIELAIFLYVEGLGCTGSLPHFCLQKLLGACEKPQGVINLAVGQVGLLHQVFGILLGPLQSRDEGGPNVLLVRAGDVFLKSWQQPTVR
jgi:hypothetical protein